MVTIWDVRAHDTPNAGLRLHGFTLSSLRIVVYVEASFANNTVHSTHLSYMVLRTADTSRANVV